MLRDFPGRRVIQLPQTIHFQSDRRPRRDQAGSWRASRFPDDRERPHVFASSSQQHFDHPSVLAPDSAFYLGRQDVCGVPVSDVVWLKRLDKESQGEASTPVTGGLPTQDWLRDSLGVRQIE